MYRGKLTGKNDQYFADEEIEKEEKTLKVTENEQKSVVYDENR